MNPNNNIYIRPMYVSGIHISGHSLYPQCPIVHIIAKKC